MKYCRLEKIDSDTARVVEFFNFDPFIWIPNSKFLESCAECPDDTTEGMVYKNGVFYKDDTITAPKTPEEKIAELEALILQQQEVIDTMLNGGGTV